MTDKNRCFGCMEEIGVALPCPICGYQAEGNEDTTLQLSPGAVLHDTYLVGRALGQGGFGITYLGWDLNLNIKLAIKEFFPQQCATRLSGGNKVSAFSGNLSHQYAYGLDKFLQEARILARFEGHPNIVAVRNYFQANGTAYLVMSYVEGVTLKEYLKDAGGTVPSDRALALIKPVLEALKEIHAAGILHRDISPDNIFINKKGQVVLLDFGAARQAIGEKEESISIILKPGYAPEEQYRRRGMQGPWTDIYAVAATMYYLVTGAHPHDALERLVEDTLVPPSRMDINIPVHHEEALLKALAVRAPERFQTVEAFHASLTEENAAVIGGQPTAGHQSASVKVKDRQALQSAPAEGQKQAAPISPTSVLPPAVQELFPDAVSNPVVVVRSRKKMSPLAIGGATVFTLAILVYFVIRTFSGLTEPTSLQPETRLGEPDIIPAAVGETVQEENTISMDGGIYSGQLLDGLAHGHGVWTDSDGTVYEGEFAHGMANGRGVISWPDGTRYEGQWKNDEFHGYGFWIDPDGSTYEGDFANDMFNGRGVLTFPDGESYEGEFYNDMMHGWGKYTFSDGIVFEGRWEEDEYKGD